MMAITAKKTADGLRIQKIIATKPITFLLNLAGNVGALQNGPRLLE